MQPGRCSVSGVTGVPEATVIPAIINKITSPSELSTFYYGYYPYYPIYSMCQDSGVYNVYRTWPAAVPSKIKQWYLYLSSMYYMCNNRPIALVNFVDYNFFREKEVWGHFFLLAPLSQEEFEDTKEVIRICKS